MRLLYRASAAAAGGELAETELQDLYRHPLPTRRRVWLRSNFVTSLDGSIQGPDGRSGSINTASDQHLFALHRAHADVILVGASTVRSERYRAVDLAPWQRQVRAEEGLSDFPVLAVVTRSLALDPGIARHGDREVGRVLIFTTGSRSRAELAPFEAAGVEVVPLPSRQSGQGQAGSGVDELGLDGLVEHLGAAGLRRVLCEGGARLHRDLLAADLVDELSLTLAPVVVGGTGSRTTAGDELSGAPGFALDSALLADDGALFLSYHRTRNGST